MRCPCCDEHPAGPGGSAKSDAMLCDLCHRAWVRLADCWHHVKERATAAWQPTGRR